MRAFAETRVDQRNNQYERTTSRVRCGVGNAAILAHRLRNLTQAIPSIPSIPSTGSNRHAVVASVERLEPHMGIGTNAPPWGGGDFRESVERRICAQSCFTQKLAAIE